jgi:hypothetical protein
MQSTKTQTLTNLEAQRAYVQKLKDDRFDFDRIVAGAFVRGIRDIGYRSTATALNELIDNAIQGAAQNVYVVFGYGDSDSKPDSIAVIDDGHGMDPLMVRASVIWGGTHREGDRTGFGRYGYGLPSASVSQGQRFTVFSRPLDGSISAVTIDVEEIGAGECTVENGRIRVPEAKPAKLPKFVLDYLENKGTAFDHGTIVLLEKLDRLTYKTTERLERFLLEQFGITYRNFLRQVNIEVNDKKVEAVDPLFLTPGARYYDVDEDRAEALPPQVIEVKDKTTGERAGTIGVRYSIMPPTFQVMKTENGGRNNARLQVMKAHNGIVALRNGRQIDVVTKCPWKTSWQNYDRNWKVELDFSPVLDEEFSITTSKQQITISERIWEILREAGVSKAMSSMNRDTYEAFSKARTERQQGAEDAPRTSEKVMQDAEKFKPRKSTDDPIEQTKRSIEALKQEARKRAAKVGLTPETVEQGLVQEATTRPFKVETESMPGAPFYRMVQIGGQKVLYLNTSHRFYTDVYAGPDSTPRMRAALELLLFVIGDCELDATSDRRLFYETEKAEWSKQLNIVLTLLDKEDSNEEQISAREGMAEDEENVHTAESVVEQVQ